MFCSFFFFAFFLAGEKVQEAFPPGREARAVVEGRFLSMRGRLTKMGIRQPSAVLATGGGTNSPAIMQVGETSLEGQSSRFAIRTLCVTAAANGEARRLGISCAAESPRFVLRGSSCLSFCTKNWAP